MNLSTFIKIPSNKNKYQVQSRYFPSFSLDRRVLKFILLQKLFHKVQDFINSYTEAKKSMNDILDHIADC